MLKIIPVVSGLLSADATTKMFFGVNIKDFFAAGWSDQSNVRAGGTFSQAITLSELVGVVTSNQGSDGSMPAYGISPGFSGAGGRGGLAGAIGQNMRENFIGSGLQFAVAAALPKIMTKTGVTRNANKLLKGFGLSGVVQL